MRSHIHPQRPFSIREDSAGNRWLETALEEAKEGDQLKLDFSCLYQVEVKELLEHAILMTPAQVSPELDPGDPAAVFLGSGLKIRPELEGVAALAEEILGRERVPRRVWARISKYIKDHIPYDHQKRAEFFGGRKVYRSMAEMYDPPEVILERRVGACPETCLLEASLFRAVGIPARTAGRWGHFFTEVHIPGRGLGLHLGDPHRDPPDQGCGRRASALCLLGPGGGGPDHALDRGGQDKSKGPALNSFDFRDLTICPLKEEDQEEVRGLLFGYLSRISSFSSFPSPRRRWSPFWSVPCSPTTPARPSSGRAARWWG